MSAGSTSQLARRLFRAGRWADAARTAHLATQREPAFAAEGAMIFGVSALRQGRPVDARPALAYARSQSPDSWFLQLAYAEAALGCGDDVACADAVAAAEELGADPIEVQERRAALRGARGELPVTNAMAWLAGQETTTPGQWESALRVLLELGMAAEAARLHAKRPPRVAEPRARLLTAQVATAARDVPVAVAAWLDVLAHEPELSREAFEAFVDLNATEEAQAVARQAQRAGDPLPLGRLALYGGRLDEAGVRFRAAPPSTEKQAALAALALCRGDATEALAILRALERGPAEELMLVEALRRTGDVGAARAAFDAIGPRVLRQVAAAPLCRVALVSGSGRPDPETLEIVPALRRAFEDLASAAGPAAFAEAAIDALSGNWSARASRAHPSGRACSQPVARPIREQVAELRHGLSALPLAMIVGRLEQLEAERGAHPLIATYGAELLLWAGDYDQAAVWLQRAVELDDHTRWAYIGLAILHNVTGRPEAALKAIARQQELLQPLANSFVCTAEAHLQLGDLGRAVTDYEAAVEAHPTRVAAWLGLAAARQRRGQSTAAPLERVRHLTPVFFGQWQQEAAGGDELEHLEHGLRMLRGNRGSGLITWRTRDGALHGENAGR